MGYGIVVFGDDPAVRRAVTEHGAGAAEILGAQFLAVVGDDRYPTGGIPERHAGPFTTVGAWAAQHRTVMTLDRHGVTVDTAPPGGGHDDQVGADDPTTGWVPQMTAGAIAAKTREFLRAPWKLDAAMAAGVSPTEAVCGANQVAGVSLASLWWLYADALASPIPAAAVGTAIVTLINTHVVDAMALGQHLNALNKAGALVGDHTVRLVWSGNRICRLSDEPASRPRRMRQ